MTVASKNKSLIGTLSAQGYIIRSAQIYLSSPDSIENPGSKVEVEIVADLLWVNRPADWGSSSEARLRVDIDNEEFLMQGKPIKVINGKEVFDKIMRVLVGSLKI